MCFYEDEIWPSRYHDPVPDPAAVEAPPVKPELTNEEILERLKNLSKDPNRNPTGFQF